MVPISGVVRFLPFGQAGGFQPYVGGGVSAVNFRYSETGEFVDPTPRSRSSTTSSQRDGYAFGAVILGGAADAARRRHLRR